MPANKTKNGFTLIELSVVLVIIGLITGGVLAGRWLIRSAELQSIIADQRMLVTSVQTFRTKYNELPGDMTHATDYWGTDPAGCPNIGTWGLLPRKATCNGNGDGFIQNSGSDYGVTAMYEQLYTWQHLANAGVIKGAFTGTPGPVSFVDMRPGINVPGSRIANAGFELYSFNASTSTTGWFLSPIFNQHYIVFGGASASGVTGEMMGRILTPDDAYILDQKIDDGKPGTGVLISSNSTYGTDYPACSDTDVVTTAKYNTALKNTTCTLLFKAGF